MFTELLDKMSRSGRRAYEVFTAQAVCSTIAELQLQKIKEENHAGGSYTENDCPCFQVLKVDCRCTEMVKYFCNIHTEKNIDWNISFQTVSCIHLMNVDVYDCNSHIHNPACFHLTLDLFQTDSVV